MISRAMNSKTPSQLSDAELVDEVEKLARSERRTTALLVAHLAELDARRLHLRAGYPSLFVYCTQVLRLSEGGAYNRIEAARAALKYPVVLELLSEGALNVATLRLLSPHLTASNHVDLLAEASNKTKREVQALLARRFPQPDVAASVRKLPSAAASPRTVAASSVPCIEGPGASFGGCETADGPGIVAGPPMMHGRPMMAAEAASERASEPTSESTSGPSSAGVAGLRPTEPCGSSSVAPPRRPQLITPLSTDRYQIRFTAGPATCEKLRLAQDLLRHAVPDGDPAEIFDRALTALLDDLARKKLGATDKPRRPRGQPPASRSIPAHVKRAVVARDRGQCAFPANGRTCGARAFLEFHHVVPYARGGTATEGNIQLRCRAHNDYEAELDFGRRVHGCDSEPDFGRRELVPGRVGPGASSSGSSSRRGGLTQGQIDRSPDVLPGRTVEGHG